MKPPVIKVEIVHIEGPLKGTIQEFYDSVITIGRHPDCHVCFPKDEITISRRHAEIRREGNRFLAVDNSTNGTLINGKPVQQSFLKTGDVLTISEDGPKISFLTTIEEKETLQPATTRPASAANRKFPPVQEPAPQAEASAPPQVPTDQETAGFSSVQTLQKPFIVQFGAAIKSFDNMPIILGSNPDASFVINHPSVLGHHLQIHMENQDCLIKDLTGRKLVTINGKPVGDKAIMPPDVCVALTDKGPFFQFLGDGRLAEIETPT